VTRILVFSAKMAAKKKLSELPSGMQDLGLD
jgi:hypothetical protein